MPVSGSTAKLIAVRSCFACSGKYIPGACRGDSTRWVLHGCAASRAKRCKAGQIAI
ncbi:hypothetical protein BC940DRAFT_309180 [Gongronella butleri]|nr:hypothetical protein BC940DRAFT_309180 [Gongronella butleri]